MSLWQRLKNWWNHDEFAFDAEYDRMHSEINEDPRILIDAVKSESIFRDNVVIGDEDAPANRDGNIFDFNYIVPRADHDDLRELYLCHMVGYAVIPIEQYESLIGKTLPKLEGHDEMLAEALCKLKKSQKSIWIYNSESVGG